VAVPDFFTIEEAARILRIGRTAAYLAAKRYRETDGAEGLPCVAIRGSLRVPRRALEAMAGGPIDLGAPAPVADLDERRNDNANAKTNRSSKPKRATGTDAQRPLPFTG